MFFPTSTVWAIMTPLRRLSCICVAASLALSTSLRADPQQPSPSTEPPPQLEPGRAVERDISARQVQAFRVALDSGALVRVALTQRGIDLVVSIVGPDGARLAEVDSSADGREQEALALARHTGDHRVEIRAFDTTAAAGRYTLTVVDVLSPGELAALSAYVPPAITKQTLQAALQLVGLTYSDPELALLLQGNALVNRRRAFDALRAVPLPNSALPSLFFEPLPPAVPVADRAPRFAPAATGLRRPANLEDVAFWSVTDLAALIRTRQVTSVELTRMYLERLRRYDPVLYAVVTFTDSLALEQARRADREIAAGRFRGPLHGIPFGVKDLYAVPGYPTTWGAEPYRDQVLSETATAVRKLEEAGAVLVAKLATGALAMGDVWFRERTRNPWNPAQGSSGSSAGPAAAVSAGLVPFALGTETLGSIISPATTTGVTGLRPSYGRVSRAGVMALSWSMDKPGPLCRNAEDCALVFNTIRGRDPADPVTVDAPFPYDAAARISGRRIGYIKSAFEGQHRGADLDRAVLEVLRRLGANLVPLELPARPADAMQVVLSAEAAAAFDDLTRSGRDSLLRRQDAGAWPNSFRSARFIPAVEYLQASRVRRLLQQDMDTLLRGVDAYVAPSFEGANLLVTNLTGHPCVAVPDGFLPNGDPASITFCAPMYGEAAVLEVARAYQAATPWDERHPAAFGGAGR